MNLLLSTGAFPGFSIENSLRLARDVGADGVEFMLTPRLIAVDTKYVRSLENRCVVPIKSIHTTMRLRSTSPETVSHDIIQSARFAAELPNCEVLVVHTPQVQSLHDPAARSWFDAISAAVEISEGSRFTVTIENSGRTTANTPTWAFDHPHRLLWLTEEWDLHLTYDTAHAASRNWEILDTLRAFLPRIANVHLSDVADRQSRFGLLNAIRRDHQLPGSGTLPLDEMLTRLTQAQFDRLITLELSPLAVRAWWRRASVRRISEVVEHCRSLTQPINSPQGKPQERT